MDPKEIRELIDFISRSNFTTFELERSGFRLRLVKASNPSEGPSIDAPAVPRPAVSLPQSSTVAPPPVQAEKPIEDGLYDMNSPIVGTFYGAAGPDSPPFVDVGSQVKKGQVLCIVEAMKVMNEIESEVDAEVVEVLVSNGQPVEYGEVLFRLRPST